MKHGTVVIGANYGDEGKGLITDFEVRRSAADLVVRFNGGAQAGHTVTTAGKRHVFGHFGAGTFAGAATYLSSHFIVNPFVLDKEINTLKDLIGTYPEYGVHPTARVTTLFDMALNSLLELSRGDGRHGSCGLGINETVTRHEHFPLTYQDLYKPNGDVIHTLEQIRDVWVPRRMAELDLSEKLRNVEQDLVKPYLSVLETRDLFPMAIFMKRAVIANAPTKGVLPSEITVFEGAQGLALDEYLGEFPHVTRSITGLPFALAAAHDLKISTLRPIYVTRSYLTRHGAGPLEHEGVQFGAHKIEDQTNIHNQWQGSIRFAPLNLRMLAENIANDTTRAIYVAQALGINLFPPTIAITCLDQLNGDVQIIDLDGQPKTIRTSFLPRYVEQALGYKVTHVSNGPTADDVQYSERGQWQWEWP